MKVGDRETEAWPGRRNEIPWTKPMKAILTITAGLLALWSVNTGAVATISLNNYDSGIPIIYYYPWVLMPKEGTFVELVTPQGPVYDTANDSSLIPMTEDGFFFGGVGVVPGIADNAYTELTLRVWRGATTYSAATERGEVTWGQATGSWNPNAVPPSPPTGPALMYAGGLLVHIPEPSIFALCLIGGAAMLGFGRKTLR